MILAFIILSLVAAHAAWSGEVFSPLWQKGDKWTVETVYPLPYDKDRWSRPVYWEYEVMKQETGPAGNRLVIEVWERDKKQSGPVLRLFYEPMNHTLVRAESIKMRRANKIVKTLTYEEPRPVFTEQSPAPFDTPLFPLQVPSTLSFSFTQEISDGLKKNETVEQEVRRVALSETTDIPPQYEQKELIQVRCYGTASFIQYWDMSLPWPVYGRNPNMKYRLMER